jgi:hypothetical protein
MNTPSTPTTPVSRKPVKYLTNKELLAEISRCKNTFSEYLEPQHSAFDLIVTDLDQVNDEMLDLVCAKKSKDLTSKGETPVVVPHDGLVVRLMTYDHIPLDPDRKRKSRAANQTHALTNFPPYKHFLIRDESGDRTFLEVGRSHWTGGFANGHFQPDKGRVTERMGMMYWMLVERYARRANWRGYTYLDEMKSLALMQLSQVGLQFDESKSSNPFAFYTTTITNCFTRVFNVEKKNQNIRDDLLIAMGAAPSYTRQVENELSRNGSIEPTVLPTKRGRKTAVQVKAEKEASKQIIE